MNFSHIFKHGFANLWQGFMMIRLWRALGWLDIQKRYKRTLFGMSWILISFSMFLAVKLLVFSQFSPQDFGTFAVYLAIGLFVWRHITQTVVEGCNSFIHARPFIEGDNLPLTVYVGRMVYRTSIISLFSMPMMLLVIALFGNITWQGVISIPLAFLVYVINAIWVAIFFGIFCTRWRDLQQLINTVMQFMFFLTPIFWVPDGNEVLELLALWNPFAHFIEIMRAPFTEGAFDIFSWIVVGCITVLGYLLALPLYFITYRRIVFWL